MMSSASAPRSCGCVAFAFLLLAWCWASAKAALSDHGFARKLVELPSSGRAVPPGALRRVDRYTREVSADELLAAADDLPADTLRAVRCLDAWVRATAEYCRVSA